MKLKKSFIAAMAVIALSLSGAITLIAMELTTSPKYDALPSVPEKAYAELIAVGDNLMHMPVIKSCQTNNGYYFDGIYENILSHIENADIKAINQETIFINDPSRYSGYPSFGGPSAVGDSLVRAGFNVIEQASNHSYDKGVDGLVDTTAYWAKQPVKLLGVNNVPEAANRLDTIEVNGITVAMLNYTYSLNGYILPKGKEYLVNVLSDDIRPELAQKIARAKAQSDIVVMFVHWGTEYDTSPDSYQKDWLKFFNENGVDVIIGAHPHVLQPSEEYVGESGHKTIVFYSLGNFVSNQDSIEKELGGMARLTIVKDADGTRVEKHSLEPCFTHVSGGKYTVYMLKDYTNELARAHSKYGGSLTVEKIWDKFYKITGDERGDCQ